MDGACCEESICVGTVTEAECLARLGRWYGGTACGAFSCPAFGGCCQGCPPETMCEQSTLADCNAVDGRWDKGKDCNDLTCAIPGDDCALGPLPVTDGSYTMDNRCAGRDGPPYVDTELESGVPFGSDLWYAYIAPRDGVATFGMCSTGSSFDSIIAVYHCLPLPKRRQHAVRSGIRRGMHGHRGRRRGDPHARRRRGSLLPRPRRGLQWRQGPGGGHHRGAA